MGTVPTVSVCIPARNSAAYLAAAIDSVLAQEFADYELVVCDNASTDETPEICAGYSDPHFRAARFEESVGQAANWNRCLDLAKGGYVILLHADDELRPKFLTRAVEVLDANEDVGLVHCAAQHIDESGALLELQRPFDSDLVDRQDVILRRLLEACVVNPAGVLVRREAYDAVGRFTDEVVWGVDWHMWIRIALDWPIAYLAEPLALYREHTQSGTSGVLASARNARDERWVIDDIFRLVQDRRPELIDLRSDAVRSAAHRTWCLAEDLCQRGETRAARRQLRQVVATRPASLGDPKVWALWAATYLGYDRFRGGQSLRERLSRR
jgi:glycosyltransferase involved in cell wall biosynthesis